MDEFVDYEKDYEPDDTGKLSTSEYWRIIKEEYRKTHPQLDFLEDDELHNRKKSV